MRFSENNTNVCFDSVEEWLAYGDYARLCGEEFGWTREELLGYDGWIENKFVYVGNIELLKEFNEIYNNN